MPPDRRQTPFGRSTWPFWSALITLALMGLLFYALSRMIHDEASARAHAEVRADLAAIRVADALSPGLGPLETIERAPPDKAFPGYYLVIDPETRERLGGNLKGWPIGLPLAPPADQGPTEIIVPGLGRLTVGQTRLDGHFPTLVARRNDDFARSWAWARWGFLALSVLTLGFTAWAWDGEARRLRREAGEISATLSAFAAGKRDAQSTVDEGVMGELARLANQTLKELGLKMDDDRAFADKIAHQLRAPIGLARMSLTASIPPKKAVGVAQRALDSLLNDIDAVVNLAHLAEHGLKRRAVIDLAPLAQEVAQVFEPLAETRGARIVTRVASAHVEGDADLLKQALANALTNAIKFGPPGGVIEVTCGLDGEWAVIDVLDQGPGAAGLPEVIGLFRRGPAGAEVEGRGLGLHLIVEVVSAHDGRIAATDRPTGGLDLRFRLPRHLAA